jgi:predicted GH43/DUF377 family glycosyl hydrolase
VRWESGAVFNPAVCHHDGVFHLFYRAIYEEGEPGEAGRVYNSCIGHARSLDGIHFQCDDQPVLRNKTYINGEIYDAQDPRISRIDGTWYMVYTNWKDHCRMIPSYAVSEDLEHWEDRGPLMRYDRWGHNKNALLFPEKIGGRFAAFHRPEDQRYKHLPPEEFQYGFWTRGPMDDYEAPAGIAVAFSEGLDTWEDNHPVLHPREGKWDCKRSGSAGPPLRTENGWLTVYHGIDMDDVYRLGLLLLDPEEPWKIIKRREDPILEPEMPWEREGDVPNVVFSCGSLLFGTELWVYYGAADTVVGLAIGEVGEFLEV